MLKSFKPAQKLPLLNDISNPSNYPEQLVAEDYLDRLLEAETLKFLTNRSVNDKHYLTEEKRLLSITMEMRDVIEHRGLDLCIETNFEQGMLLHNYNPNFERGCDCYWVEFDKNGEEICCDNCCMILISGLNLMKL